LTKYELQTEGGTYRHKEGTEQPKSAQSKANPRRSRYAPEELAAPRKIDNGAMGVVQTLPSKQALLL